MSAQNHITGEVHDTIVRVRSDIIEYLVDGCVSAFGGCVLLGDNRTDGRDEFVVHRTRILKQSNNYALETLDAR